MPDTRVLIDGNALQADDIGGGIAVLRTAGSAVDPYGTGTRPYNIDAGTRHAVGATSSTAIDIVPLGPSRELLLISSTRCFIRWGGSGVTAAAAGNGVLPLPADVMFHIRIPVGVTHFRVIRDSADGFITQIAVA